MNAASGQPKPSADATETHSERITSSCAADVVALGAYVRAGEPIPRGVEALGRWFLEHHRHSLAEALGAVLVRITQLERQAADR